MPYPWVRMPGDVYPAARDAGKRNRRTPEAAGSFPVDNWYGDTTTHRNRSEQLQMRNRRSVTPGFCFADTFKNIVTQNGVRCFPNAGAVCLEFFRLVLLYLASHNGHVFPVPFQGCFFLCFAWCYCVHLPLLFSLAIIPYNTTVNSVQVAENIRLTLYSLPIEAYG